MAANIIYCRNYLPFASTKIGIRVTQKVVHKCKQCKTYGRKNKEKHNAEGIKG